MASDGSGYSSRQGSLGCPGFHSYQQNVVVPVGHYFDSKSFFFQRLNFFWDVLPAAWVISVQPIAPGHLVQFFAPPLVAGEVVLRKLRVGRESRFRAPT